MFTIESTAFPHEGEIPRRHTCEGGDVSPSLSWHGIPPGTRSFALIVDDPDAPDPAAPKRVWVHWVRYNLPVEQRELREGAGNRPPDRGLDALTDAHTMGYHGPCPPIGRHRYFFHLFALDTLVPDLGLRATRRDLDAAMEGHVLGQAVLMGMYAKG